MLRRRALPLALVICLTLPAAFAQEPNEAPARSDCPGYQVMPGIGPVCPRGGGAYELIGRDGRSLGSTHGADPPCAECEEPLTAQGTTSPHCVTEEPGVYAIHVIYARATDDADQYASKVATIRSLVGSSNAMVDDAAIATGERISLRVLCDAGGIIVRNAVLPTPRALASFDSIVQDLQDLGYNSGRQKYWVYYDDAGACACAGAALMYFNDAAGPGNPNNGNGVPLFAVSFDSASTRTMLHEIAHTMGAVQNSAPRSSGAGHCNDGLDTMCYRDGGPWQCTSGFSCPGTCAVEVFDCGKDTYCHATPAPGSYLATRWQVCSRDSRYIQFGPNVAPTMTTLSCAPSPSFAEEVVTCSFAASDTNSGVYYVVDWGDGTPTTRVPSSGHVPPGGTRTATHTFATSGDRTVSVVATDNGSPALTSAPLAILQPIGPPNVPPAIALSCLPAAPDEGETVTCTFSAEDAHNVSYTIAWGDATPSERVPASGVVPPANVQTRTHVYGRGGTFVVNVTATDDGRPPKASARSVSLPVTEVNTAPVMTSLTCPTHLLRQGEWFACSFRANDDSPGVRYEIDWGDGTSFMVPSSGHMPPGTTRTTSHAYSVANGTFTVSVRATDDFAPPATGAPLTATVRVQEDQSPPVLTLQEPRSNMLYRGCDFIVAKGTGRALFVGEGCLRATATDATGVARVELWREGKLVAFDTTAPYEIEFEIPRGWLDAAYEVRAVDVFGYTRTIGFRADAVGGTG